MKLRTRRLCRYVFAYPSSSSSSPILERVFLAASNNDNSIEATSLAYCNGDTQAMIDFMRHSIEKIRHLATLLKYEMYLICLYHTNFCRILDRSCQMIKAIVVDHGSHIQTLNRHCLLHDNAKDLFISRSGCVKRSTWLFIRVFFPVFISPFVSQLLFQ